MACVTQKEIADKLKISQTLVSDILGGRRKVNTQLHHKIMEVGKQLGYRPNHAARSLLTGQQKAWNIVLHHFQCLGDFNRFIIQGISKVAQVDGISVSISTQESVSDPDDFIELLTDRRFDGMFVMDDVRTVENELARVVKMGIPLVVVNCPFVNKRFNAVYADGASGIYKATRHLIENCGRKKVSACYFDDKSAFSIDRYAGFVRAHEELGVKPGPEFKLNITATDAGYEFFDEHTTHMLRKYRGEYDAIVCFCDYLAANIIGEMNDMGLRVPEDVAITGFDDLPLAKSIRPRLTTIGCDGVAMGQIAAKIMKSLIASPDQPAQCVKIPTSLVIRESCYAGMS